MFSKALEYAIRAVLYIAVNGTPSSKLGIKEIADEIDSPVPFTAKILQTLSREGIVSSSKGPNGGFYLDPNASPTPIHEIVIAIDGDEVLHACALGLKECSDKFPCPIHHEVKSYKDRLREIFNQKTIQQLANEIGSGKTFLKNSNS